ncbi:beta-lactamase family protein [Pelomyxa schiedti]|nr:beta-lactamase family protein [Pelomyxa schiedti]
MHFPTSNHFPARFVVFLVIVALSTTVTATTSRSLRALDEAVYSLTTGDYWTCPWRLFPVENVTAEDESLRLSLEAMEAELEMTRLANNHSSVVVQIVYRDVDLWFGAFGFTDAENTMVPTADTIYRIASMSKTFAVLSMLQQHEAGKITSLNQPISEMFPEFYMPNQWETTRGGPTWRQVASQVGGLPREIPCSPTTSNELCTEDTATILERVKLMPLIMPPGTRPSYSNLGFGLIGRLLETTFGMSYEDYVTQSILTPLGMTSTGFEFTDDVISRMARGYAAPLSNLNWAAPSGQMYSSSADFAKYLKFFLRWYDSYSPSDGMVLDGETVREWLHPSQWNPEGKSGFGMPWENYYYNDHLLVTKCGNIQGYGSIMTFIPELQLGISIFINGAGSIDQTEYQVVVSDIFVPEFVSYLQKKQPSPQAPPNPEKFVGAYMMEGSVLTLMISQRTGMLVSKFPGVTTSEYVMSYQGDLTFQIIEYAFSPTAGCMEIEFGSGMGNWLFFKADTQGNILSFQIPALYYDVDFIKVK